MEGACSGVPLGTSPKRVGDALRSSTTLGM